MPTTSCPTCGEPVYRSQFLTDAGAEVYCSEACGSARRLIGELDDHARALDPYSYGLPVYYKNSMDEIIRIVEQWYAERRASEVARVAVVPLATPPQQ